MSTDRGDMSKAASLAMDRYARGEDAAFGELYDALVPRLLGFLFRQTRDHARAEDLVQQTFLQMHCARETYVRGADVVPWAFSIARRLSIDAFRRSRRDSSHDSLDDGALLEGGFDPDHALRTKQAARALQSTLERLPAAQRIAFELVKYEGLSIAQAAETLGVTTMAVKVRLHRASEALRTTLGDEALVTFRAT